MKRLRLASVHLFNIILFLLTLSQAQEDLVGPTTTPDENSSSITTESLTPISTVTSGVTSTLSTQIVFVTECNTCSSSSNSLPTATSAISSSISSEKLGGIIGGCAGAGILIIIALILVIFGRKRYSDDFETGLGVSSATYFNDEKNTPYKNISDSQGKKRHDKDIDDKNVKRYNFSNNADDVPDTIIPPVIIYSDALNQQQQKEMGINNVILDSNTTQRSLSPTNNNGARLSKYNFLSQAFSQMRSSYAMNANGNIEDQSMQSASQFDEKKSNSHDSILLPKEKQQSESVPKKYQMYSMYQEDSNIELVPPTSPPAVHSVNSFYQMDSTRESTMTVGTLHAPVFLDRTNSPLKDKTMIHRDSIISDVSQYSTFPTSPKPPLSPSTQTSNSTTKRYSVI